MKKYIRRLAMLLCGAVFLVSAVMLARDLIQARAEDEANHQLAQQVHQARQEAQRQAQAQGQAAPPKYAVSGILYPYDGLYQQNHDMAGWLFIPDTPVDYPVMYTPEDPEYYLYRGFDKNWAGSGCLFLAEDSPPDSSHVFIHGHHMKNGTMLGSLDRYKSADYWAAHPTIFFDTLWEEGAFEVLAAFRSKVYYQDDQGGFRYYQYADLSDEAVFSEYVRQVKAAALYDTGVDAQYGDRLLTLSTCSYHTKNGRFVVVARQVPKETAEGGINAGAALPQDRGDGSAPEE